MDGLNVEGREQRPDRNAAVAVATPGSWCAVDGGLASVEGRRNNWRQWQEGRPVRLLLGVATVLAVALVLAHVPLRWSDGGFDGFTARPFEQIQQEAFQMVTTIEPARKGERSKAEPSRTEGVDAAPAAGEHTGPDAEASDAGEAEAGVAMRRDLVARLAPSPLVVQAVPEITTAHWRALTLPAQLDDLPRVEDAPRLKSSSLRVGYPEDARRKSIQGRVVLRFVVEPDGRAYGIEVVESLYPSCDIAAVKAIRAAEFTPGYQDGEAVPAMSALAIHFVLYG